MAAKQVATTKDLAAGELAPGEVPDLSREVLVENITAATDPDMVAKVDEPKYVKLTSVFGTTTVPESLVGPLLSSGYKK